MMARWTIALAFLVTQLSAVGAASADFKDNIDLPGSDYRGIELPRARVALCRDACAGDKGCVAWTFVHPGVLGLNATCWLKNAVPAERPSPCCISGLR
jgi:hypothetical protein